MNTELLLKVKAAILAEPDAFRMDTWSCGTAHCIAGWAIKLSGLNIQNPESPEYAQRLEDGRDPWLVASHLLDFDSVQDRLFYLDLWPGDWLRRYRAATNHSERAAIAAERIDLFIEDAGS